MEPKHRAVGSIAWIRFWILPLGAPAALLGDPYGPVFRLWAAAGSNEDDRSEPPPEPLSLGPLRAKIRRTSGPKACEILKGPKALPSPGPDDRH